MMKKSLVTTITMVSACLVAGCANNSGVVTHAKPDNAAPPPDNEAPPPEQIIGIDSLHILWGQNISFHGESTLPDGTYLQTQLYEYESEYEDAKPASWWPADEYVQVQNGRWETTVSLTGLSEDVTKLYPNTETMFVLKVWEKDNSTVLITYGFDLMGPPPAP